MKFLPVTLGNLKEVIALRVAKHQEGLVADNLYSVAQVGLNEHAWCRLACDGDRPVGFFAVVDEPENRGRYIWRFMVAEQEQGKGYGRRIMTQLLDDLFADASVELVDLNVVDEPGSAQSFYAGFGFEATGETDGREKRMVLSRERHAGRA